MRRTHPLTATASGGTGRAWAMRRLRRRAGFGTVLMLASAPLALASIPAAALFWLVGLMCMGLSIRGLDMIFDGERARLPSHERNLIQVGLVGLTIVLALITTIGFMRVMAISPWVKERIMSQVREYSGG